MIVAFEGTDAAGKKTQSELLEKVLGGKRFAFPNYDSSTGSMILAHLKREWSCVGREHVSYLDPSLLTDHKTLDACVFQSLQAVNRIECLPAINECLSCGQHVIFDRYWQSAFVYGALDGLDVDWLRLVQQKSMPAADVNIFIDVSIEESFKRRPERRDRYEINRPFLEKVRNGYTTLWTMSASMKLPGAWYIVDGSGTIDEVHARVMKIVENEMPLIKEMI